MIDAGIWGQLPSMINGGIFADAQQVCTSTTGQNAGRLISSGTTILVSQTITPKGKHVFLSGSLLYILMGTNLGHELQLAVDSVVVAFVEQPYTGPPLSHIPTFATVAFGGALTPGSHTFDIRIFVQSTGLGNDQIGQSTLLIQDCP